MPALNSLILGPGLGRSMPISLFVEEFKQPLVLDADALWALIKEQKLLNIVKDNSKNIILTPNQVEMKRIMNFLHLEDKQIHFNDQYTKTDDLFVKEVSPNDQIAANAVALSIELNNVTII
jgi:NAD(P)H-hydrate repair Nnr-like enzyme with NAD(P)H-hydrate dehydratase domain